MPAPRKGSLITIFVPKPHSSHVFGPHTILGLSGSDLISLQFGHFLYFFQRSGLLKTNLQSNYMGTPVLASIYAVCCIYPVLHKTLGRLEPLFVQQSIEAGRHLLFTNVLNVFLSITFSSDCQFLPLLYHQYHHQFSPVLCFSTYFHQLLDAVQLKLASHLLRYPLQQHKPNVCPIKSISNPNRDQKMNLDQFFMRHYESIKKCPF